MKLPRHLAIIMDGNGRWAQMRSRPRVYGHLKGTRVAKKIITDCSRMGVQHLTLYAFSAENWLRPESEVSFLMTILRRYLRKETKNLVKENIRFSIIGDLEKLPDDVLTAINYSIQETKHCTGLHLVFAISYGSRQEITEAFRTLADRIAAKELSSADINESLIQQALQTSNTPDPDLIIRTSGEKRISNFLLWQAAYSELYFSETLWPDFTQKDLIQAFNDFSNRERRFGKTSSQISIDSPQSSHISGISDEQLHH